MIELMSVYVCMYDVCNPSQHKIPVLAVVSLFPGKEGGWVSGEVRVGVGWWWGISDAFI